MTPRQQALDDFFYGPGIHARIVRFAQESYAQHGRGVVMTSVPQAPSTPDALVIATSELQYSTLEDLRTAIATLKNEDAKHDAAVTLTMVETYSPSEQAVVMVDLQGHSPVSVKLRFHPRPLAPGSAEVH